MRKAFTLIELLITASIAALVAVAIFSVFAAGINVYNRVRSYSDIRTDILFSLEKIEKDLKNTPNISQIAFIGKADIVTFPKAIGSVSYYIDNSTHYLVGEDRDYSAATAEEPPRGEVTPLVYADSIKFSYFYYDSKSAEYYWKEEWAEEKEDASKGTDASRLGTSRDKSGKLKLRVNTPLGVKIDIKYEDHGKTIPLTRTVFLPLAVSLNLAEISDAKERKM